MRRQLAILLFLALAIVAVVNYVPVASAQPGQSSPARSVILDTVTTGTGGTFDATAYDSLTFYLTSVGTTSGGTVILEEADWDPRAGTPYTGTWSQIASVSASTFTGGVQLAYHVTAPSAFAFVRARIGSTITGGGTVSVVLHAK